MSSLRVAIAFGALAFPAIAFADTADFVKGLEKTKFCIFGGNLYSLGALLCVGSKTAQQCRPNDQDPSSPAKWVPTADIIQGECGFH